MPIGTGIIYNVGDLILSTVSGSGTAFLETKIAAATSSIVYFDSNARINSASLNSITVGTASYVSGSTSIITNLTASNISASGTSSFGMIGIRTNKYQDLLTIGSSVSESLLIQDNTYNFLNNGIQITTNLGLLNGASGNLNFARWTGGSTTDHATVGQSFNVSSWDLQFSAGRQNTGSTINYFTSSAVRMTIKSTTGDVGIGTTNPADKLHVIGNIRINGGDILNWGGQAFIQTIGANDMFFRPNSTLRMILTAAGNLGLGNGFTSPAYLLDVSGSSRFGFTSTNTHQFTGSVSISGSLNATASWANNALTASSLVAANSYTITNLTASNISASGTGSFGYVGIGTNNPTYKLDLQPTSSVARFGQATVGAFPANSSVFAFFGHTNLDNINTAANYALLQSSNGDTFLNASSGRNVYFRIANSDKIILNSSGQVGIGTTAPIAGYLDVRSNQTKSVAGPTNIAFFGSGDSTNPLGLILNHESSSGIKMIGLVGTEYGVSGNNIKINETLTVQYNGYVGIGTTVPTAQLHVCLDTTVFSAKNVVRIVNLGYSGITGAQNWTIRGAYQYAGGIAANADGGDLDIIKSLDRNTILATKTDGTALGNVGIGTTAPAYLLDVSGSSRHGYRAADTHQFTGSVSVVGSVTAASFTGSLSGSITSALTASYLTPTNSYTITNLTASNISVSATGSFGIVGIGSSSPGYTLEVNGTQRTAGNFYLFNTVVNPASNFSNQRGVGFEASTGKLEVAASASNALTIGRFGSTGQILDFRYAGTQIGNFSLDTNDLTLATARHLILSPTGNVGIGTTVPNSKLEVAGTAGTGVVSIVNTTNGRSGSFGIDGSGVFIRNSSDGDYFDLKNASGVARFRVIYDNATHLTTNFVSIGNLSATGSKLSVFGNTSIGSTYGSTAAPTNGLIVEGKVGIGTTSLVTGFLDVRSNASKTATATNIVFFGSNDASNPLGLTINHESASGIKMVGLVGTEYGASGNNIKINETVTVQYNGSVGIGTTAPAAKLEISGSSNSALLNIKSPISGAILFVSGSGAVGINTSTVGAYTLQVNGSFAAETKSFVIEHPTKSGKKLIYGSLESPYHGIRLTGRNTLVNGKCKIQLPDYMYKLILHDSVNIQLTGIKCNKTLYIDDINVPENYFTIAYDKTVFESYKTYDFFWDFTAIRADVPELQTEM
jgi:hypothetical protein